MTATICTPANPAYTARDDEFCLRRGTLSVSLSRMLDVNDINYVLDGQ